MLFLCGRDVGTPKDNYQAESISKFKKRKERKGNGKAGKKQENKTKQKCLSLL